MKNLFLFTICILTYLTSTAQVTYQEFYSSRLDDARKLKIQLPRNYDPDGNRTYPIVLVLDGDYLFEPVAGNVDYFSYWEDMPEAIVVGIMQDRKSTRLNSSHVRISYAVFCLKKKKKKRQ